MSRSLIRFGHTKIYRYFEVEDPEAAGALVNKRFEGTIIETYKKQGLEVFKIVYDDGDVEEVLWEELQELLEKAGHGAHFETIDGDREYDDAEAQRERIQDSTVILSGDPQPYDAVQDIHEIKDPQRHDAVLDRDENKDDSWQSLHAVPYHQGNITVGPGSPSETLVAPNNISTEISHEGGTETVNNGYHEPSGVGPVPMDEPGHENEEREGVETELSDVTDADKYISVPSQKNAEVLGEADDLAPMDSDTTESSDDGMGLEPEELKDDSNMANEAIKFLKGEVGTTPTAAKRPRKSSGHAEEKKTSPEAAFSKKKRKGEARGVSGERKGSSFLKESDVASLLSHPIEQQPSTIGHKTGDSTGNTGQRQPHCSVTSGHHRGRPAPRTGGRRRHVTPSPSPEESRREARPRRPATRPRRRSRSPPWCEDCVSHRELCGACQRTPGVCFRCGDHGHRCKACPAPRCEWCGSRQCRDRDERGGRCAQGFESRLCFVCRKRGHVASTCQTANMVTQRQVLSFLENPYLLAICSKCGDNTGRCSVTCIKEQTGLSAPTSSARERCFGCSKEGHILKVCRYLSQCRRCCLYGHIDIDCDQNIPQGSADTHYPEKYSSLRHQRHSRHRSPSLSESRSQFHSYCRSPARSQFHSRSRSCSHSLSRSRSCSQSRSQQGGANSPGPRSHHGRRRSPEGQRRRRRSPPHCRACRGHDRPCAECSRHRFLCWNCGDRGHRTRECPAPRCAVCGTRECCREHGGDPVRRVCSGDGARLCFGCGERGHTVAVCPYVALGKGEAPAQIAVCPECGGNGVCGGGSCPAARGNRGEAHSKRKKECVGCRNFLPSNKHGHTLESCWHFSQCQKCWLFGHTDVGCLQSGQTSTAVPVSDIPHRSADTHCPEKDSSLRHQQRSKHRSLSHSESRSQFHSDCRSPAGSRFHPHFRSHSLSRSRSRSQTRLQRRGANSPGRRCSPEGQRRRRRRPGGGSPPHCRACRGHDRPCAECSRHRSWLCWNCGDRGHRTRECPAPRCVICGERECFREHGGDPIRRRGVCSGDAGDSTRLCFGCAERGHAVPVCPRAGLGDQQAQAQLAVCSRCGENGVCGGGSCPAARGKQGEAPEKGKRECFGCRKFLPSKKNGHTLESCWYFSQCQKCCLFGHIDVGCLQGGQNSTAIPVSSSAYVLADFLKDSTQQSDVLLSSGPKGLESSNVGTRQQRSLPSLKIPDLSTYEGTAIEEQKSPMPSPMDLLETLGFGAKKLSASKTIQNSSRTTVYHFEKGTCSPAAKDDSGPKEEAVHNATEINTAGVVHLSQPQKVKRKSKKYPTEKKNNATPSSKATEKHNIVVNETLIAKEFPNGKIYTGMVIGYYESKYHVRFFEDSYTHSYSKKEMVELMDETPLYQAKLAEDTSLHLCHDNNKGKSTTAPAQKARERKEIVIGTTRIRKKFKGHKGWFNGIVSSQGTNEGDYKVVYEDGDQEDLSEKDILRLWCDDTTQEPFTPTGLPSLEPCPWKPCEQCQKEQKGGWACRLLGGGGGAPHRGPTPRGADGGPGRPWAAPPHFEEYRRAVRGLAPEILVEHKMDQSLLQIASWDHFQLFCHKMDSHDSVKMPKAEKMKSALAFMNKVFTTADKHAISVKDQHKDKVPADMMRTSVKTAGMKKVAGESKKNQEDQSLPEQPSTSTKDYKIPVGGIRGHQTRNKLNCKHAGCTTRVVFNVQGEQGKFCNRHKHEGMVNVVERTCEQFMCYKAPSLNVQGEGPGRFCAEHKQEGMVNVNYKTRKKCIESGCVITANYGFADQYGKIKRLYCASHRHEGMVLLSNKNKSNK